MKLNKTLVAVAVSALMAAPIAAQAEVKLSGSFGFKGVHTDSDNDNEDLFWGSSKTRINIKGDRELASGTKVIGEVEVDYDTAGNAGGSTNAGDLEIRTSRMLVKGGFGTLLMAGRTASGQWANLVGPVDIFQHGGANFFVQPSRASNVFAYVTPTIAGGLNLIAAGVANGADDGEDLDATVLRAQYKNDMVKAAVGLVSAGANDYQRMGLGVTGMFGPATVGVSFESNSDHPTIGDKDVMGVAATFDAGSDLSFSLGYNAVLKHENTAASEEDANVIQVLAQKGLGDGVSVWAEFNAYNDEAGADDQIAIGMNLSF